MLFSFYLPLINSSLLQDHLPPESPEVFFPTRGLPHLTSPWSYIISFLKKGIFVPLAFNYLSSSLPSHATPALAYFTSATGLPALLQTHQACPYPRVLAVLFLEGLPLEGHWPPSLPCFKSLLMFHLLSVSDLTTVFKTATLSSVHTPDTIILLHVFYCSMFALFDNML